MPSTLRRTRAIAEHIQRHDHRESTHLACVRFFRALRAYEAAWGSRPGRLGRALEDLKNATADLTGGPDAFRRAFRDPRHRGGPYSLDEPLAEQLRAFLEAPVGVGAG
ncbi:hypothetical protein ACFWTE_10045 [Nocardiopsis sp. NPDC058631]|uniref:hypothetical protein n=1 Tax=Nocardiopsis sp. NPDC058631 TaxID=3346566 RepID=UPI003669598E